MLSLAGILVLALSVVLFFWTLRRGIYRRYPWEHFVLVGISVVFGISAALDAPNALTLAAAAVEVAVLAALLWYLSIGARLRRGEIGIHVGDRFPHVVLPDSEGNLFDSGSLVGRSTALYLFYRGDW